MCYHLGHGLYKKIQLALFVVFLLLISLVSETLAQTPGGSSHQKVAIMFLVDESGGMNGECAGVGYTSMDSVNSGATVLDVDSHVRKRYQIIRFFMAVVGSVYDAEYGRLASDRDPLPLIEIGVAQFADKYKLVYPFVSAEKLFETSFSINGTDSDLNPCHTNYILALEEAARALEGSNADYRVLILITDGSFRGTENNWSASIEKHTEIRNAVGDVLQGLSDKGIRTFAFVLGRTFCESENTCGLQANEYEMRRGDLGKWIEWDNINQTSYLRLLQSDGTLVDLINEITSIKLQPNLTVRDITPSPGVISTNPITIALPSITQQWIANIIPIEPCDQSDLFEFMSSQDNNIGQPELGRPHPKTELGNYWWRYHVGVQPISFVCEEQLWAIKMKIDTPAYIWYHLANTTIKNTSILQVNAPEQIVRNDHQDLTIKAHVDFSLQPQLFNAGCYKLVFRLYADGNMLSESPPAQITTSDLSHTFDLSNIPCATHHVRGEAAIIAMDSVADELATSINTEILFQPEVVVSEVQTEIVNLSTTDSVPSSVTHIITVPIEYAGCNSNFVPIFTLEAPNGVTYDDGRPSTYDLAPTPNGSSDKYEMASPIVIGNRLVYVLKLKSWENGKTYRKYGYYALKIEVDGVEPVTVLFDSSVTSPLTPTPTKGGGGGGGVCGSAPLMLVILMWFLIIRARPNIG